MPQTMVVLSEPAYLSTHWYTDTLAGLQAYAAQKELPVCSHAPEADHQQLEALGLEAGRAVILLGTSHDWIDVLCRCLGVLGVPVLVAGGQAAAHGTQASFIGLDYRTAMLQVTHYLTQHGRTRFALLGHNPASASDREKAAGLPDSLEVFCNTGDLSDCVRHFLEESVRFDAVICCNDVVALQLLRQLRLTRQTAPLPFFVVSFGDTLLGNLCTPSLTSVTLNYREMGRQAGALLTLMNSSPVAMSVSCRVRCRIIPRQTTEFLPVEQADHPQYQAGAPLDNRFYKDASVREVLLLEELLNRMDSLDCQVLLGVLGNGTYALLAERLHISEGTVKYRLRRMMRLLDCANREQLLAAIGGWLGPDALLRLASLRECP